MGAPAAVVRVVRVVRARAVTSTEAVVARYIFASSAMPTARGGIVEAEATSLLASRPRAYSIVLAEQPDDGDGGGCVGDYWRSGSRVAIPPRPRANSIALAEQPDDGDIGGFLDDYRGSGSRGAIPPPPLAYPLARPRLFPLRIEARPDQDDDDVVLTRTRPLSLFSMATPSPGSTSFRICLTGPRARIPFMFAAATCPGPLGLGPKRFVHLPTFQGSGRRHLSGWCWTPWNPNKPENLQTSSSPKGVEDILKMLKGLKLTKEGDAKLKEYFLEKFYSEEHPQKDNLKLDLLLHRQVITNKMLMDLQRMAEKKKWGSFTIWGRKVDLATWVAALISLF